MCEYQLTVELSDSFTNNLIEFLNLLNKAIKMLSKITGKPGKIEGYVEQGWAGW